MTSFLIASFFRNTSSMPSASMDETLKGQLLKRTIKSWKLSFFRIKMAL